MEHQRLLARIRNHEDEKQVEPPEQLIVTPTLASFIEASSEYLEDPKNLVAKNEQGRVIRMKMKVTISYKGSPSAADGANILKNVQV